MQGDFRLQISAFRFLMKTAPALGGGEGGLEVFRGDSRREADVTRGAVVIKAAQGKENSIGGHGAGVVVAGLGFIEGVAFFRTVGLMPIVDGTRDGEALGDHALVNEVRSERMLKATHRLVVEALMEGGAGVPFVPRHFPIGTVRTLGPGRHHRSGIARHREGAAWFVFGLGVIRTEIFKKIVSENRGQRGLGFLFRQDPPKAGAPGPLLAKHLVDVAAIVGPGTPFFGVGRAVDEAVAIPKLGDKVLLSLGRALPAFLAEVLVAGDPCHFSRSGRRGEPKAGNPRAGSGNILIERVVGHTVGEIVAITVLRKKPLGGSLDLRPIFFDEVGIGRCEVIAIRAEDDAALAVDGCPMCIAVAEEDGLLGQGIQRTRLTINAHGNAAIRLDADAGNKVSLSAQGHLEFREKAPGSFIVVPDMVAGPDEGVRAFESVKPPVLKAVAGVRGEGGKVGDRTVEHPAR